VATANFVFYASGEDETDGSGYSIAGVVAIAQDGTGDVVGGEQDYNDAPAGSTSPQPSGDTITGGTLVMNPDGSGNAILTLTTSNTDLPNAGTEVFALAFANANHASIVEFDQTATSLGSLDLQTSTAMPVSSSFSFVALGTNSSFDPSALGGVFAIDGTGVLTGTVDRNDSDAGVMLGITIPANAQLGPTDPFGRGTITGSLDGSGAIVNYYIVGPEVVRLIDVDTTDNAAGSAYGQGSAATTFSSASIGQSVFQIGNSQDFYGAVGQFTTSAEVGAAKPKSNAPIREQATACTGVSTCSFTGVGDLNDLGHAEGLLAEPINGTYMIAANGYGNMDFGETFDTVTTLGVYAVDPTLNILDPNNTGDTADSGGALIAEMDINLVGVGSIVPQTDVTVASFTGNYAFGAQGFTTEGDEFDFVGTAAVTPGATTSTFVGEGALSDPADALATGGLVSSTATFNATATADPDNAGRYTLGPLTVASSATPPDFDTLTFITVSAYQASGGQLFWLEVDEGSYFLGPLEQGPGPSSDARKAQAKSNIKKH
jgi:hypothetical protein